MKLKISEIKFDPDMQSRVDVSEEVVNDYTEALREGAKFPSIKVLYDGTSYFVYDGWQRCSSHKKAGLTEIEAEVIEGTRRDAILYAVGANFDHGLRRTNADKRKAVMTLLDDVEWCGWNDVTIAKHCHVSSMTVGRIRKETNNEVSEVKVMRGDKEFTMKKPEPKAVATASNPEYVFDDNDKIHEMATEIQAISEENEILKARVAVAAMEATDDEKEAAQSLIAELQTTVKAQESEIVHYKARVHSLMNENNELKKQIKLQDRQIFAMRKQAA
jgi:regulator of replication initiation timing